LTQLVRRRLVLAAALAALAAPGHAAACRAIPVTDSIQAAVDQAQPCDWVVIQPGTYRESVLVRTPDVHLRGLNRNGVVLDGEHRRGVNGIEVRADGVSVENLTVRNFEAQGGSGGNQIWWNGGDGSGTIGIHGWSGRYLTAYDTGLIGQYGLFTSNAVNGSWDHVYASGFADSGIYLGACRDCRAVISHALVERNALGYSGTNSGGHVVVQDSVFRNNSVGIAPNSLAHDDPPPPQLGTCDAGANTTVTPTLATTRLARCTVFRRNRVERNNNLTTPANETTSQLPWGTGIELPGTYGDLIANNIVSGNRNFGILAHEYPDPFPPTPDTLYFQSAGNRVAANIVRGSKWDIALEGGLFGAKQSVNNCVVGNHYRTSLPADLRPWTCANATTPNVEAATANALLVLVLKLQAASLARHPVGQPAPPPQPTMPNPCRGVPANPLCP
jgi:hypothetical protein